jgi:hypothetical protein
LPTVKPGAVHIFLVGDGEPLDVDYLLAVSGARSAAPNPTPRAEHGDRYIDVAFERECNAVVAAGQGRRNLTLNRATYALARLHVSSTDIERALFAAAVRAGLPQTEALRTIRSALRARRGQS